MSSFEKRFGKYAVQNLTLILIICYAVGYVVEIIAPKMLYYLFLNPEQIIYHGQVWRLVSWVVIPPSNMGSIFFTLIMLYFYYSLGTSLERAWGTYRYNIYLFSGILFTILGAFVLYLITRLNGSFLMWSVFPGYASRFSTYYVNMSIFLAFAATFPDNQILFMFFIPIKVKYLGIIYAVILGMELLTDIAAGDYASCVVMIASLMNFFVFYYMQRKNIFKQTMRYREFSRRYESGNRNYYQNVYQSNNNQSAGSTNTAKTNTTAGNVITRHKCAVCGQTEVTAPNLAFRFCSKCNGNYEYCENHIFTHKHVE